jgi:protein O-mannosyl-transferase
VLRCRVITSQASLATPADVAAFATRWPRFVWCGLFLLLSVGLYARTLDGWFLSDDGMIGTVIPDGTRVNWDHVRRTFATDWGGGSHVGYYRPVVVVTQAIDAALWGLDPWGYRLTNMLLHGLSGFLLCRQPPKTVGI